MGSTTRSSYLSTGPSTVAFGFSCGAPCIDCPSCLAQILGFSKALMKGVETSVQDQMIPRASDTKAVEKTTDSMHPEAVSPSAQIFSAAVISAASLRPHTRPEVLSISRITSDFPLFATSSHNSMKDSPHGPLTARTVKKEDPSVVVCDVQWQRVDVLVCSCLTHAVLVPRPSTSTISDASRGRYSALKIDQLQVEQGDVQAAQGNVRVRVMVGAHRE
ncbi:hypothetical protein EDB86DRAFT_3243265 [Lactarius hatsudake]|nr:hypothetical protein EDB86DRAFT_3243265 [Lactarius hatsudake]